MSVEFPSEANNANIECLAERMKARSLLAFVGAGLSVPLGYPSWKALMRGIHTSLEVQDEIEPFTDGMFSYEEYAERLFRFAVGKEKKDAYYEIFREKFGRREPPCTEVQKLLVQIPFRAFLTTNYDPCLEHAISAVYHDSLQRIQRIPCGVNASLVQYNKNHLSFLREVAGGEGVFDKVLHLHGMHDDPEHLVVTKSDYDKLYESQKQSMDGSAGIANEHPYRKMLWALATFYPFVFIGFSGNDEKLMRIIKLVRSDFNHRSFSQQPFSFGIFPWYEKTGNPEAETLEKNCGIKPIYYLRNDDDQHVNLLPLLQKIYECGRIDRNESLAGSIDGQSGKEEKKRGCFVFLDGLLKRFLSTHRSEAAYGKSPVVKQRDKLAKQDKRDGTELPIIDLNKRMKTWK